MKYQKKNNLSFNIKKTASLFIKLVISLACFLYKAVIKLEQAWKEA